MKRLLFLALFSILLNFNANAQALVDEWEASIGYLNFQGDYGQRADFETTLGSKGGMIGGKIYFNLLNSNSPGCYLCQHLKFHLGFNTGYSTLNFDKAYYDYNPEYEEAINKIKAISGQVYFFDLGFNVEYHLSNLRYLDFFSTNIFSKIDPYIGLGIGGLLYGVDVESELGNYEKDPSILPGAFVGGIFSENSFAPSANLEVGLRYRFSQDLQLSFNNKWMYFLSDRVDGLEPNPQMATNKYNDWLFSPSIGVVIFIY